MMKKLVSIAAGLAFGISFMAFSVWIYPSGFSDIPIAEITFGLIGKLLLSVIIFISGLGIIASIWD